MDPTIYLTNHSSLVTDAQVTQIAAACATQVTRDCAPAHGLVPVPVMFTNSPPPGARIIDIVDVQDDPQALGWHTEDGSDHIYGVSSVKPVLDNGGQILTGALSVSSVVSHEVLEMFCDPWCSAWADSGKGFLVAWEVGDPVQSDSYIIGGVAVSNFVTVNWFNPYAASGDKFDFMGKLARPFTLSRGGYWVQERSNRQTQKLGAKLGELFNGDEFPALRFDDHFPGWLRQLKEQEHTRTQKLIRGPQKVA
jgi:hypothetical protein